MNTKSERCFLKLNSHDKMPGRKELFNLENKAEIPSSGFRGKREPGVT